MMNILKIEIFKLDARVREDAKRMSWVLYGEILVHDNKKLETVLKRITSCVSQNYVLLI